MAGPDDVVSIISTEPLTTDEQWLRLQVGEAVLLRRGELLHQHLAPVAGLSA
ncbi:MAG: class II glutamine amidotransferase [Cyanobacteria bacterium]|nr:class II glutamine amidotransferase [Cyanobacteriota bacterium]